jgi:mono/diheme cytochrome c family protein
MLVAAAAAITAIGSASIAAESETTTHATAPVVRTVVQPMLDSAGEGRRAYLKLNCYGCHGMFAVGAMGPNIIRAEREDVSEALLEGKDGGMPSYRTYVTSTDISNLTSYLNSIGTPREPVFMDWWKKVPPK